MTITEIAVIIEILICLIGIIVSMRAIKVREKRSYWRGFLDGKDATRKELLEWDKFNLVTYDHKHIVETLRFEYEVPTDVVKDYALSGMFEEAIKRDMIVKYAKSIIPYIETETEMCLGKVKIKGWLRVVSNNDR